MVRRARRSAPSPQAFLFWLLAALALAPAAAPADDVTYWLERMSTAGRVLNYDGTFVYRHGARMETLRIVHAFNDGRERERLVHLNGAAREVVRDEDRVTCYLSDDHSKVVEKRRPRTPLRPGFHVDVERLGELYQLQLADGKRVAGRQARGVLILPRDDFRYGYRLWIDEDSGLLLKSDLVDQAGRPLEQIMFVTLEVLDTIPAQALEPGVGVAALAVRPAPEVEGGASQWPERWQVAWLPAGFTSTSRALRRLEEMPEPVEFLSFSDGLASLSIFIERLSAGRDGTSAGGASMGAVSAYGRPVEGHFVTVVGEVPPHTVRRVAESVQYLAEEGR